jgi:hypothetical protein
MNYAELVTAIQDYTENFESTFNASIPTFVKQAEERIFNSVQFPSLRKNVTGNVSTNNPYLACPNDFLSSYSLAVYSYAVATATALTTTTITINSIVSPGTIQVGQYVYGSGITNGTKVTIVNGNIVTLSLPLAGFTTGSLTFQGEYLYLLNKDVNYIREYFPNPRYTGKPRVYALFGPQTSFPTELSFIVGPTPDATYTAELHYFFYPESIVEAGTSWLGDNFDTVLLYGALREAYLFMKGEPDMIANVEQKYMEALQQAKRLGDGLERSDAYRSGQARVQVN